MYKNQLQELAQRSCFNLPSYACIREGPDHAPRFKASVYFNGEIFDSSSYCNTLRQAEHAAAEAALNVLSTRGPSRSLTARVLDETGVYKNLLQETAHRAGLKLPVYTTVRSGPGHVPVFTSTVEMAGMNFTGGSAKTKKQAEKNAAIAAWSAFKKLPNLGSLSLSSQETKNSDEQDQVLVATVLSNFRTKDESKQVTRDQQNQARRRMVRGHRGNASNYSVPNRQLKSMDLLLDSASDGPKQKQNILVSLLPPPPPRTTSKTLPPTSSGEGPSDLFSSTLTRPTPIRVFGKTQVKIQEVPPPIDEHQRDEDEWLSGKSDIIKSPLAKEGPGNSSMVCGADSIYSHIPLLNVGKLSSSVSSLLDHSTQNEQTHIRSRLLRGYNPQRIAPAVQIRSMIPVCAAPPLPSMKEAASASPSATYGVFKHTVAEASSASPKFNNPELCTTQFDSMFNEKLQ